MENRNKINSDQLPGSTSQGKIKTVIQTLSLDLERVNYWRYRSRKQQLLCTLAFKLHFFDASFKTSVAYNKTSPKQTNKKEGEINTKEKEINIVPFKISLPTSGHSKASSSF